MKLYAQALRSQKLSADEIRNRLTALQAKLASRDAIAEIGK